MTWTWFHTACLVTIVLVLAVSTWGFVRPLPRVARPVAIAVRRVSGTRMDREIELSDGQRFRSDVGVIWYSFPDAKRISYDWNAYLDREWERLTLLDEWSETDKRSGA